MSDTLYEQDFFIWTQRQAEELRRVARQGSNLPLDWENLAEEIESLGKRDRREVGSLVRLIVIHLIKLAGSPADRPRRGWQKDLLTFRDQLQSVLRDSPSLKARLPSIVDEEWDSAFRTVEADLRIRGEYEAALPVLTLWTKRSVSVDDISTLDRYPERGTNRMATLA